MTAQAPDVSRQPDPRDRPDAGRAADARAARDGVNHYDADAEFKRPVPKPDGYLPDDTGGAATRIGLRDRGADEVRATGSEDRYRSRADAWKNGWAERPGPAEGDRAEALLSVVDRPPFHDPTDKRPPDRYGDPLTGPDGTRVPCFDGPPRREQTRQGWAGDCGIIAALGAVAAHRPEDITDRIRPREDGTYEVTLNETRCGGGVTEPTGRDVKLSVTPELPVHDDASDVPSCAKTQDGAAWCAAMEKAFAGVDQTWTAERRAMWEHDWDLLCAQDRAANKANPRSGPAPDGYVRMHQGTTAWERAEALTQLTGQHAMVCEFPAGIEEYRINRIIRAQLDDGKPVLVSSRPEEPEGEPLPHNLDPGHVYEVTGIEKGKILLRNPWHDNHPEPMETDEFARNMNRYYSTLM